MEALEFLKETQRMCSSYKECTDCPLKELASFAGYKACRIYMLNECEKAISAVDAWSKKHPIITNAQKFKEVFGEKTIDQLALCETRTVGPNVPKLFTKPSSWWDKPYKEPQKE